MGYNAEVHGPLPQPKIEVWVRLDHICIRPDGVPHKVVPDGLEMAGAVRGLLSRWHRTVKGDWVGVVNFHVPYADERRDRLYLADQLVPAYALRPRDDHRPI